jgi:hypothetical protein
MPDTEPKVVYHYTNNEALISIVNSGSLWASDAEYLNDAQEMLFGRDQLQVRLGDLASKVEGEHKARARFIRAASNNLQNRMRMFARAEHWAAYVCCFCGNGDLLSQWRGYSSGGGVAIGFNREALLKVERSEGSTQLVKVQYGTSEIDEMLDRVLSDFGGEAREDNENDDDYDADKPFAHASADGYFAAQRRLLPALAGIKDEAFSEEREWRLIAIANTKGENFRVSKNGLVPYVSLKFPAMAISEVVVGPGGNLDLRIRAVERLLEGSSAFAVKVRPSAAPFRG